MKDQEFAGELVKVPESKLFVRFQDCDPLGHLNNVRYIEYFLNAREEHTYKYYNMSLMELARQHQANWVVSNHQIAYLKPANLGAVIYIQTRIIHFDNTTIVIEGMMFNKDKTKLKSLLWTTMRYVSLATGKPTDHPDDIMNMLELLDDNEIMYEPDGFQTRIKQITRHLKSLGE
ncbi:MAG: acyl-CoA thioesterase [Adhaeribacter sp.]